LLPTTAVDQIFDVVLAPLEIETRPLGTEGLTIPRVALGCGNFGGVGSALDWVGRGLNDDQAFALMDAAWEMGITHFDTADAYGGGHSERAIGRWIDARGVLPTLTTKTFHPIQHGGDQGLAASRIQRRLPASLERLRVGRVELYLAHDWDPGVPLSESLGALQALKDAGKVGAYGVSNFNFFHMKQALREGAPVAVQNGCSLLARDDESDLLPLCAQNGIAYLAFGPLCGGWLTGTYRRERPYPEGSRMTQRPEPYKHLAKPHTFDKLEALEELAARRGMSMAGVALAWLLADERITQVVIGPGKPEHLDPLREAFEQPLTPEEHDQLDAMFAP
jgi:aryl-alcohol dehydrogenase-like predicted oxidoreductase